MITSTVAGYYKFVDTAADTPAVNFLRDILHAQNNPEDENKQGSAAVLLLG
jgi:hypothetical protein